MKVSDYIVEYLIHRGIEHVFGYPGGMVTHLMDSFSKYQDRIVSHITYHEQSAAFAACGYAQASGKVGVAYATSGPGATNLITGICNAYFDSIPTLFITGQVNLSEIKGNLRVRQRGFQETDIVSIVEKITKYAGQIEDAGQIKWYLDYAFLIAEQGRKGPVLLDIPMNIFRAEIIPEKLTGYLPAEASSQPSVHTDLCQILQTELSKARRPVLLLGNGLKISGTVSEMRKVSARLGIPVVSTMPAVDVISDHALNYGFIGAYGSRTANFITAKSDLLISLGARLDIRQVGAKRESFAPDAKILRIDIDPGELKYKVHSNEIPIHTDVKTAISILSQLTELPVYTDWIHVCNEIRHKLSEIDQQWPNEIISALSELLPDDAVITADVGQNQVWVAQSLKVKEKQRICFSGGHGAMGYSLPAAIGCALAGGKTVYSFNGDGGIQMNIQELQTVVREKLPIKIILINNFALGMIRHFQEMYFDSNYFQTVPAGGYTVPDFEAIAKAYGLKYQAVDTLSDIHNCLLDQNSPELIEVRIPEKTYVYPKLEFGKPNQDQEPLLDRKLYEYLCSL